MDRDAVTVVPEAATAHQIPRRERANAFRALRSRPFRWYFAGQIASASGTFVQATAVGWLVLQLTGSPASLGVVLAAGGVPPLLFGPWGGVVADRVDLRRLLIGTQVVSGLLAAVLWAAAVTGRAGIPLVIGVTVAGGVVQIVDSPARQAFVAQLVPSTDLASAASVNGVVMNSARVVGPALAGLLIAFIGTTPCFAVNAISYLAVVGALVAIRPTAPATAAVRARSDGVLSALRYARTRQQLWLPLTMMALVGLFAFNFPVLLPVLAESTFHGTGGTYGLLSTMLSIGSVGGSLAVGLVRHPRRTYLVTTAAAFGISLAATAVVPNLATACAALIATGFAGFSFVTMASTALQLHADPSYRGRIMALWVFVFLGTTPIGSLITGWIIDASGPRAALLVGALSCLVAAAIAGRVRTPPHPDGPDGPE
ncbi:MFS transporter [Nocardia sp. NPDC004860]|uniref:MFS transporter n=1 Tax=Nocardia sp. NPDC004860 TaxID=3154557 RepID=UPI0033BB4D95